MLKVVDGKFKPQYGKKGKPFLCFPDGVEEDAQAAEGQLLTHAAALSVAVRRSDPVT